MIILLTYLVPLESEKNGWGKCDDDVLTLQVDELSCHPSFRHDPDARVFDWVSGYATVFVSFALFPRSRYVSQAFMVTHLLCAQLASEDYYARFFHRRGLI
jgi:hypothetical protein